MAVVRNFKKKIQSGTAVKTGGSDNLDFTPLAGGVTRYRAEVLMMESPVSSAKAARMLAECVVASDGTAAGTRFVTAMAGATNPASASNATASQAQASEFTGVSPSTLVWSHVGGTTTIRLTVTNNDTSNDAFYVMEVDYFEWIAA